jgi:hypothetical protein
LCFGKGAAFAERRSDVAERVLILKVCSGKGADGKCQMSATFSERVRACSGKGVGKGVFQADYAESKKNDNYYCADGSEARRKGNGY